MLTSDKRISQSVFLQSRTLRRRSVFTMRRRRPGVSGVRDEIFRLPSWQHRTVCCGSGTDDNLPCMIHNIGDIDMNTSVSGERIGVSVLICYAVHDGRDDLLLSNRSGVESQHITYEWRWIIIEPISRTWRIQGGYRLLSVPADLYATIEISFFFFWKNVHFFFFLSLGRFKILRKNRIAFEQY